ncbi:18156_t:CDS:2 [Cetraspora pellucida]|uniref:18156_t:CDS:1 n=1 Tax=Cetraspora pellucida TaxID=1433469 RepID=A0ACA9MP04_9GLOM|nr:18156_t:CDS:2 [Cetraspora pellucida]
MPKSKIHAATYAGSDVKQKFLRIVSSRNHPRENETKLDFSVFKKVHTNEPQESYYQPDIFSSEMKKECDRAFLKFFICCGIPFSVVEHPFFLEFIKCLNKVYEPPK